MIMMANILSAVHFLIIQSLRVFRLALFCWFGGSGVLFCLVCLVGLVGLFCFLLFFQNGNGSNVGVCFTLSGVCSWLLSAWRSLFLRCWCPWVVFGRVWCPGGPGRRCWRNSPLQWTPFGFILGSFWSKTVMCLSSFVGRCVL